MSLAIDTTVQAPEGAPTVVVTPPVAPTTPPATPEQEPAKGTPEYETWLTAKAQASLDAKAAQIPAAPEGMPEQFYDATTGAYDYVALAKSYTELRTKMDGAPKEATPPVTPPVTPPETPPGDAPVVDRVKFTTEIMETGGLSEASYAELEKKGFDKDFVDAYIEGQKARVAQRDTTILTNAGVADIFPSMTEWARSGLSAAELATFNTQVKGSDESATMALQWLKAKYEGANGAPPRVTVTGGAGAPTSNGFASRAEAVKAMTDTRYKADPGYRAEVDRKLANKTYE